MIAAAGFAGGGVQVGEIESGSTLGSGVGDTKIVAVAVSVAVGVQVAVKVGVAVGVSVAVGVGDGVGVSVDRLAVGTGVEERKTAARAGCATVTAKGVAGSPRWQAASSRSRTITLRLIVVMIHKGRRFEGLARFGRGSAWVRLLRQCN